MVDLLKNAQLVFICGSNTACLLNLHKIHPLVDNPRCSFCLFLSHTFIFPPTLCLCLALSFLLLLHFIFILLPLRLRPFFSLSVSSSSFLLPVIFFLILALFFLLLSPSSSLLLSSSSSTIHILPPFLPLSAPRVRCPRVSSRVSRFFHHDSSFLANARGTTSVWQMGRSHSRTWQT